MITRNEETSGHEKSEDFENSVERKPTLLPQVIDNGESTRSDRSVPRGLLKHLRTHPTSANRAQEALASKKVESRQEHLESLAKRINVASDTAHSALKQGAYAAMEAGRLLCKAKELVLHGQWRTWLSQNTTQSERTAQLYMQFARKVDAIGDEEQAQRVADLSFRSAMAMLGTDPAPASADEQIAKRHPSGISAQAKAMKVALRRIKGAIKPILDGEVIDAEDSKEAIRALKELIALLKGCDVASTNANTTHDVIAESESR